MTIAEFYVQIEGDYQDALGRLMTDQRIAKYLMKFIGNKDVETATLNAANQDWEALFRVTHNLKGVALNLSLTALGRAATALCEAVRHGAPTVDIEPLLQELILQGDRTQTALQQLQASL